MAASIMLDPPTPNSSTIPAMIQTLIFSAILATQVAAHGTFTVKTASDAPQVYELNQDACVNFAVADPKKCHSAEAVKFSAVTVSPAAYAGVTFAVYSQANCQGEVVRSFSISNANSSVPKDFDELEQFTKPAQPTSVRLAIFMA